MLRKIPFQKILTIGAVATASIFSAKRFGMWRRARIDAGGTDPMPWAVDIPGGTATVAAAGMAAASAFLLKGKARELGYLAAGVALLPAGTKLIDQAITSDHRTPTDQQLLSSQANYAAASANLAAASADLLR